MEEKIRLAVFGQKRLSREGGIEIVVKELCTRMAQNGCDITCYNRAGHHVSGAEYDKTIEYDGIRQKVVPTIEKKGLAAVSSSFFAALCSAFGRYDVVHIHAEGPAFFCWIPKLFGKRVISTIHGLDWDREKWRGSVASKFIRGGEKNAVKYADEPDEREHLSTIDARFLHMIPDNFKMDYLGAKKQVDARVAEGAQSEEDAEAEKLYLRFLMVTDFISGMTDSYARNLYRIANGLD